MNISINTDSSQSAFAKADLRFVPDASAARIEMVVVPTQSCGPPPIRDLGNTDLSVGTTLSFALPVEKWSSKLSRRFNELAVKEALSEINSNELMELEKLQVLRRELTTPRTGEEILRERIMKDKALRAVNALSEFFDFINATNQETKGH